ncbi:MAG TPA: pyridoxamine 5'-phosphate oxidase family protein [Albitalea sp.]|uniref:pyridoxamine 5'-phosphate oxidase family protein n=1 Tax=Piscinibacter sp. TaxID=1903157 RepID=UPI002ED1C398
MFHAGELAVQERAGVREKVAVAGTRMIRAFMPEQHRELFEKLPTLFVGSLDAQGRPWASVLAGRPGFVTAPDERHLRIAAHPEAVDPLAARLAPGTPLGLLGLEPHTRRRNRMNGTVVDADATGFGVEVDQSFGNCPQYIQAREPQWVQPAPGPAEALGAGLNDAALRLVARADTLFIASASQRAGRRGGAEGVDVSHRGGRPGFVRAHDGVLTLPDYRGNNLFNTLGNIAAHPRAGLLFVDYASGDLLQLTGAAHIIWDGAQLSAFEAAQRLVRVEVDQAWWRPAALPLRWSTPEFAPQLS